AGLFEQPRLTGNPRGPFVVIPEMPQALSGIFADAAERPRISASAFRGGIGANESCRFGLILVSGVRHRLRCDICPTGTRKPVRNCQSGLTLLPDRIIYRPSVRLDLTISPLAPPPVKHSI